MPRLPTRKVYSLGEAKAQMCLMSSRKICQRIRSRMHRLRPGCVFACRQREMSTGPNNDTLSGTYRANNLSDECTHSHPVLHAKHGSDSAPFEQPDFLPDCLAIYTPDEIRPVEEHARIHHIRAGWLWATTAKFQIGAILW